MVADGMVGKEPPMTLSMRLLEFVVGNGMAMFIQNLVGRVVETGGDQAVATPVRANGVGMGLGKKMSG